MTFTKRLREGVRRGEITCSVRIWTRPHVRVGARYRMEEGEIQVDSHGHVERLRTLHLSRMPVAVREPIDVSFVAARGPLVNSKP